MSTSEKLFHSINDFFERYAHALEAYDAKGMASRYMLPCLMLSDESGTTFTEASKLEGFFNQGIAFYKQFGIVHARPEIWSKRLWTDRIAKVKLNWQYFDIKNKPVYECDYHYIVKLDKANDVKIALSVSVNEKEHMETWRKTTKGK